MRDRRWKRLRDQLLHLPLTRSSLPGAVAPISSPGTSRGSVTPALSRSCEQLSSTPCLCFCSFLLLSHFPVCTPRPALQGNSNTQVRHPSLRQEKKQRAVKPQPLRVGGGPAHVTLETVWSNGNSCMLLMGM